MEHSTTREASAECARGRRPDASSIAVLLQLHSEFTRSCFAISIVGSIVNALHLNRSIALEPASIAGYLPARPLLSPELARNLIEVGIEDDLCRASFSVGNQLQLCVDLSHAFAHATHKCQESLEPLSDAWQRLSNACFVLEYMIGSAIESANANALKPSRIVFGPLLRQIGAGFHPCVDDQGVICLPGWAERRHALRTRHVAIPASIEQACSQHRVLITDISSLGVGLSGAPTLEPNSKFVLRVGNSPPLSCTVRWSDDDRAGALFEMSLHRIDLDAILGLADRPDASRARVDSTHQPIEPAHAARDNSLMDYIETPAVILGRMKQ